MKKYKKKIISSKYKGKDGGKTSITVDFLRLSIKFLKFKYYNLFLKFKYKCRT